MLTARTFCMICATVAGAGLLASSGMTAACANPYSLPVASSGPVSGTPVVNDAVIAARQLAAQVGLAQFTSPTWRLGLVRHIVMFRYKSSVNSAIRAGVTSRFLRLVEDSRRPDGSHPVRSIEVGEQNSGEGTDVGLQQVFLLTFGSEGDRNFYVGKPIVMESAFFDPAHEAFKQFAAPYIEKAVVFDYDLPSLSVHSRPGHACRPGTRR